MVKLLIKILELIDLLLKILGHIRLVRVIAFNKIVEGMILLVVLNRLELFKQTTELILYVLQLLVYSILAQLCF